MGEHRDRLAPAQHPGAAASASPLLPKGVAEDGVADLAPSPATSSSSPAAWASSAALALCAATAAVLLLGFSCFSCAVFPHMPAMGPGARLDAPPLRFLAVGDWGRNGTFNQTLVADQMGEVGARIQAQFVVSTGDNFYEEGLVHENAAEFVQSFSDIYTHTSLQVPWYSVLGNHDYYGNVLAQLGQVLPQRDMRWRCARSMRLTFPLCGAPPAQDPSSQRWRRAMLSPLGQAKSPFDCAASLDLFLYDTTPLVHSYRSKKSHHLDWRGLNSLNWTAQEEAQLQELEGWLKASQATWKVVVGHHPVYSFGHHGNQKEIIEGVNPLLKRYGVDVYMNGHDHNIQHIKRADSPVHYLTNGGGSKSWRSGVPEGKTPGLQYYWPGQGFGAFEVSGSQLNVSFYGVSGDVLHSLSLNK